MCLISKPLSCLVSQDRSGLWFYIQVFMRIMISIDLCSLWGCLVAKLCGWIVELYTSR